MRPRVFVVQPIPQVALDVLREAAEVAVYPYMDRQISEDELIANTRRSDWLFVMHETHVSAEVLDANPHLQGIGVLGSTPHIDMEAANARKIPIVLGESDPATKGQATADLTMAMLLALAYRLVDSDRYTRCGKFRQQQTMALMGIGCPGRTVGLIGMGQVAVHLVPRIIAFDMYPLYTKRTRLALDDEQKLGLAWTPDLDELLKRSDFVCIACDYNPGTRKLIGERELKLMKPGAYLINTARGRIVDEPELIRALQEKRIAGAALDVYWNEPYYGEPSVAGDPWVPEALGKLDNVILAPHNGNATWDVRGRRTASIARNMVAMMRGERPVTLLNPQIYAGR